MIIAVHSYFDGDGGITTHARNFTTALERLGYNVVRDHIPHGKNVMLKEEGVHITLCGIQEFSSVYRKREGKNIAYIAWESTEYPVHFIDALKNVDELWVPSHWQKKASDTQLIKLGFNPNFVKVVPEGVDGSLYSPRVGIYKKDKMTFLIVGRWEDRKSTKEMIQYWLEEFNEKDVELVISADNSFPVDKYKSTEERLAGYGLCDSRIKVVHHASRKEYINLLHSADVVLHASRSEGWGLVGIEAMACGKPLIITDWSGCTEYCSSACRVNAKEFIKPFNVYGVSDCPGQWCEPDWDNYKMWLRQIYESYEGFKIDALSSSEIIREKFSWKNAALVAADHLGMRLPVKATPVEKPKDVFVVGCWPSSSERMDMLVETIKQIQGAGFPVILSTHYALPAPVTEMADYVLYEKANILSGDWRAIYTMSNSRDFLCAKSSIPYHAVACLNAIRNGIDFCKPKWNRMFYIEYDIAIDIPDLVKKVDAVKNGGFVGVKYEGDGIRTDLFAGNLEFLDKAFPRIDSWEQYISSPNMGEGQSGGYILENWMLRHLRNIFVNDPVEYIEIEADNLFDQKDSGVWGDDAFQCHFVDGPYLHIGGSSNNKYDVTWNCPERGDYYSLIQPVGVWSRPAIKFYTPWHVKAVLGGEVKFEHRLDLEGKRVLISMGSKALGDTMAWFPYIDEFRKKHKCTIIAASWWNEILDYPDMELIPPGGEAQNIYASYEIGCYDNNFDKNKRDWRTVTLQEVATDILGLEYKEVKPKLKQVPKTHIAGKYVCFSEHSTMQAKKWNNPNGWNEVVKFLRSQGYEVVSISKEASTVEGAIKLNNKSIQETMSVLSGAEFYIGLGHGPSWLAWALNIPVILISGFSAKWAEFDTPYRILPPAGICVGCFNDTKITFDRGWDWCRSENKKENYECTKAITSEMVINEIKKLI